jgi:site-specific DNA recombinase
MSKGTYEKLLSKFIKEKEEILGSFGNCSTSSSNFKNFLNKVVIFSSKVATGWDSSRVKIKENLQKVIFPDGIDYCTKKEAFRTTKVNLVFELNADLNNLSEDVINKQGGIKATLSSLVGKKGFEPDFNTDLRLFVLI